jgi:hypothetical protein
LLDSELILLWYSFVACPPKEDGANINIFLVFAYLVLYGFEKLSQKKCPSKKLARHFYKKVK